MAWLLSMVYAPSFRCSLFFFFSSRRRHTRFDCDWSSDVCSSDLSSSFVEAEVKPQIVDLPPESRAFVKVTLRAKRVGRWGVHGMALEVRGTELGEIGRASCRERV